MTAMIPSGRQDISEADIRAVVDVLRSDYLTQGPAVPAFEKNIADYCGAEVDFVDIDPNTYNLRVQCLSEKQEQTEQYYAEAISLPMYPSLTEAQQDKMIATLRQATAK